MSWAVQDHTRACRSRQSSHSHFGAQDQTILCPVPCFSSRIAPSAALDHGECGSVCLPCKPACRHLCWNKPRTFSFDPSITIVLGTPSCWSSNHRALCACFLHRVCTSPSFSGSKHLLGCKYCHAWI